MLLILSTNPHARVTFPGGKDFFLRKYPHTQHQDELGWEFRFGIPFPGTTGIRNSASDFGVPELSGGKANRKT